MSKGFNLKNKVSESLDLPKEVVLNMPNIKAIGDREITIENHKGIIEYSTSILRINSTIGIIKFLGENLQIKEISQEDIFITGRIYSIEFIR